MRRQARGRAAGDVLDEWRVGDDETLAHTLVTILLVAAPQFAQLDRFDIRLQGCSSPDQARG
jgi:hypothetical protein